MHGRNERGRAADADTEQNQEACIEFSTRYRGRLPVRRGMGRTGLVLWARAARARKHHDIVGKRMAMVLEIHRRGLFGQSHQFSALMT